MAAGLPGTGIGGLFFVLSAFFMLLVEIGRTLRGRSSFARWYFVLRNVAIAGAMVIAVTATIWAGHWLLYRPSGRSDGQESSLGGGIAPFAPILLTLAILGAVLAAAYLLRLVAGRRPSS